MKYKGVIFVISCGVLLCACDMSPGVDLEAERAALRQADADYSEAAAAKDIDQAMELGYRHPMGPLRLTDLVGLDVRMAIADYLNEALDSPAFQVPLLMRDMVAKGLLGKKAGKGFYDWTGS